MSCVLEAKRAPLGVGVGVGGSSSSRAENNHQHQHQQHQLAQLYEAAAAATFGAEQRHPAQAQPIGSGQKPYLLLHYPNGQTLAEEQGNAGCRSKGKSNHCNYNDNDDDDDENSDNNWTGAAPILLVSQAEEQQQTLSPANLVSPHHQNSGPLPPPLSPQLQQQQQQQSQSQHYSSPLASTCDIISKCSSFRATPAVAATAAAVPRDCSGLNYGAAGTRTRCDEDKDGSNCDLTKSTGDTRDRIAAQPGPSAHLDKQTKPAATLAFATATAAAPASAAAASGRRNAAPSGRRYQSLSSKSTGRNSLESIHSHSSSCSSANDAIAPTTASPLSPLSATAGQHRARPSTSAGHHHHQAHTSDQHKRHPFNTLGSSSSVLIGTRYVCPPVISDKAAAPAGPVDFDDQQLIACATNWQTIPLNDAYTNRDTCGAGAGADVDVDVAPAPVQTSFRLTNLAALISSNFNKGASFNAKPPQLENGAAHAAHAGQQHEPPAANGHDNNYNDNRTNGSAKANGSEFKQQQQQLQQHGNEKQNNCRKSIGSSAGGGASHMSTQSGGGKAKKKKRTRKQQIGKQQAPFMFAGILGSILGSLFFSIGMLCIKLLPDGHGLAEKTKLVFFRGVILMVLCSASIVHQKSTFIIRRDELWINVLRCVFGFAGVYGCYVSLKYISMGDSTALVFSSPVWTSLLSHFILNEPLHWIQLIALPASIAGIVLIAHPALLINMNDSDPLGAGAGPGGPGAGAGYHYQREASAAAAAAAASIDLAEISLADGGTGLAPAASFPFLADNDTLTTAITSLNQSDSEFAAAAAAAAARATDSINPDRWKGIVISLLTSLIVSLVYIVLKFRKTTPIQTTTFWLGFTTTTVSFITMCFIGFGELPQGYKEWALIVCNGVCSWLGQVLLQWALCYDDASVLSVIRTLDVAMTFTLSALFLNEQILWTSILGATIIATVVVSIMVNSWLTKKLCPSRDHDQQQHRITAMIGVDELIDDNDDDGQQSPASPGAGLEDARALKSLEANGCNGSVSNRFGANGAAYAVDKDMTAAA